MHILRDKTLRAAGGLVLAAHLAGFDDGTRAAQAANGAQDANASKAPADVYGVVNLVPFQALVTHINASGQAAFEYIGLDYNAHVGFFDGQRLIHPITPNNTVSFLGALNDRGELAFVSRQVDPAAPWSTNLQPYRWSAARGLASLPSLGTGGDSWIPAINNNGIVVGTSYTGPDPATGRGVRWNAANRLSMLPSPPGFGPGYAVDINERNVSVGSVTDAGGANHAVRWDSANRPTVLGTLGGRGAIAMYNNERGDIAGMLDGGTPDARAFLWSPARGVASPGPNAVVVGLNEAGEIAGRIIDPAGGSRAFLYSRARGLVDLHPASLLVSEVNSLNDAGISVGLAWGSEGGRRAYRWSRTGAAVDLNTRLLNPPAGLELASALAIAANGDIVAESNAGLVLLRRGGGTDAPVLGPIHFPETALDRPLPLTLSFRDRNIGDRHKATVDWGDGQGPQPATVRESRGSGEVSAQHTYTTLGARNIIVRVTDSTGRSTVQYMESLIGYWKAPAPRAAPARPHGR